MREQQIDLVIPILARHLGVPASEIAPKHHLSRDWGITPLQLVLILLDLERLAAIELPSHELCHVKTVADLSQRFRGWLADSAFTVSGAPHRSARTSRHALRQRRIRRELHRLRWLERNEVLRGLPRLSARSATGS